MIEREIDISRLRCVIDFEVDYMRRSYEQELAEKDDTINQMGEALDQKGDEINQKADAINRLDEVLNQKEEEIKSLKSILKENGINY